MKAPNSVILSRSSITGDLLGGLPYNLDAVPAQRLDQLAGETNNHTHDLAVELADPIDHAVTGR